jgi:hypothetical protein
VETWAADSEVTRYGGDPRLFLATGRWSGTVESSTRDGATAARTRRRGPMNARALALLRTLRANVQWENDSEKN